MSKITVKFEGIYDLQKKLKANATMDDVKRIVKHHGAALQDRAQEKADFKGHMGWKKGEGRVRIPPTGALKGSIGLEIKDGGLTAEVEPGMEYGPYVELGTRKMDAQPYLKPAWVEQSQEFKADLDKLVR